MAVLAVIAFALMGVGIWAARTLPGFAAAEVARLTNTRVTMGAFDFHRGGSVSIDGVVMRPNRDPPQYDDAILRARSIRVCYSPRSLLRLSPRLTQIQIDDVIIEAQCDLATGRWNLGDLRINRPASRPDRILPTVILQRGRLRYSKIADGKPETVMSIPVEATFGLVEEPRRGYSFAIKTAKLSGGYGQSHLDGFWEPGEITLAGGLSSTDIPSLERAWAADVIAAQVKYDDKDNFVLDLRIKNAHNKESPDVDALGRLVPASLGKSGPLSTLQWFFARYRPSGTVGQVTLTASGNLTAPAQTEITGTVTCTDLSVCDRKFPYAIDHLTGEVSFTQSSLVLNRLSGKHGDVALVIDGWTKGSGRDRQYQYRVTSDNMILDPDLYNALEPSQKRLWDAFKPQGLVGVDYRLLRSSSTHKREYVSVRLQQAAATYERFPYPLESLTGELYLDSDTIVASDIVSQVGGRRIRVDGRITRAANGKPVYSLSVDGNDIPLDAVLANSLPEQYRGLYEQFEVGGLANVRAKVFSEGDANAPGPVSFVAATQARLISLKPQKLPVTISNALVELSVTPESLTVKKLAGRYGDAPVSLVGSVQLSEGELSQFQMKATAERLPLSGKLVNLLPEPLRGRVAAFDPQGDVNLTVDVRKPAGDAPSDYGIAVECLGGRIEHRRFPYPLRDIRGKVTLDSGKAAFDGIEAVPAAPGAHPPSVIRLNGNLNFSGGAADIGSFIVTARNVPLTDELGSALPGWLKEIYHGASPQGSFDLDLEIPRILTVSADDRHVDFRGKLTLDARDMTVTGATAALSGDLRGEGSYSTGNGIVDARLDLDAPRLTVRGKTITDLKSQVVFDPDRQAWVASNFAGRCCQGRVAGHLELRRTDGSAWQYMLQAGFHRVDLHGFLAAGKADRTGETDYGSGTMDASLCLGARVGDHASRIGACRVDVRDMRIGKVSPLSRFLTVLQLNEPTDYAFDRMSIDSYLRQDSLLIQKLDMSGKNVAFAGSGTMDTSSNQLNLTLTARGRRVATATPGVLESLAEGLGGAVVRLEVTGDVSDPVVATKTLPFFEDSLKILGEPQ